MDRSRIDTHIKPLIGRRQVRALKIADISGMQADIAAGKTAKPRGDGRGGVTTGGTGVAARTVSTLRVVGACRYSGAEASYCRRSFMATATTAPEAKVSAPMAAMAEAAPNKSVMIPAESAPIA